MYNNNSSQWSAHSQVFPWAHFTPSKALWKKCHVVSWWNMMNLRDFCARDLLADHWQSRTGSWLQAPTPCPPLLGFPKNQLGDKLAKQAYVAVLSFSFSCCALTNAKNTFASLCKTPVINICAHHRLLGGKVEVSKRVTLGLHHSQKEIKKLGHSVCDWHRGM